MTKSLALSCRSTAPQDHDGPTVVSAGGVTIKSSLYGNDTAKWTPANITVKRWFTLINVGGAGEFTIGQAATMFAQLSEQW